jgi:glucose/arabinose dehydrogenase
MTMIIVRHLKKPAALVAVALGIGWAGLGWAQDKPAEEPFWAIGRPKGEATATMAPVPSFPVPTAVDKLPISKMKLPPGFKVEVFASDILDARSMREGDNGTVFVSSLYVAGKLYAITHQGGKREVKTRAEKLFLPSGIEYNEGNLYLATPKDITVFENIEANLGNIGEGEVIYDKLPGELPHGWKFIKISPDNKRYVSIGTNCNICDVKPEFATINRMNLDGSGFEVVAKGVRNTVGFDFHPKTGELWYNNNSRDWLSDDLPNDTLNRVAKNPKEIPDFGFPYCHQGDFVDPQFGWGKSCKDVTQPALKLGSHVAPFGMRFYNGKMFPAKYQGAIFIARHGPWNQTQKYAADIMVAWPDGKGGISWPALARKRSVSAGTNSIEQGRVIGLLIVEVCQELHFSLDVVLLHSPDKLRCTALSMPGSQPT